MIQQHILDHFGVTEEVFNEALNSSPSAVGYIAGAISEVLLKNYLEIQGFEVIRIKEKPSGGNNAKNSQARGDFYIRKKGSDEDRWLVVESKGLKSNSEFRGGKYDAPEKVFRFLKSRIFDPKRTSELVYSKGLNAYTKAKQKWEQANRGSTFPDFKWNINFPGPEVFNLSGIWKNEADLKNWVYSLDHTLFSEEAYRSAQGAIVILETHQPSKRIGSETGINQAAPLVRDFNIMSVDLFLRTGKHEFVFMNAEKISHSPTSPEHLYQNYIIDILVQNKKIEPTIQPPWYSQIGDCIKQTNPQYRKIDQSQVDNR